MKFSQFGEKFIGLSGIVSLMDDLGNALAGGQDICMLGGGNPGHIPQVQQYFKKRLQQILENEDDFKKLIGIYDPPNGKPEFLTALADLLRKTYGWPITEANICLTNGSQSSFFTLFNMFAGKFSDGSSKKIQFPLAPEYIGYADLGLHENFFQAGIPRIEMIEEHIFKYYVDFENLDITDEVGALCVSRPTNPTGNVLTDHEISRLSELAKQHGIPLIIDGAYGTPFPNIIFTDATPFWDEHVIMCLSLSKLGLPSVRTGIIIANPQIIQMLAASNAIFSLAPGSVGSMLALELVRSGEILTMSRDFIRPYYHEKAQKAVGWFHEALQGVNYAIHKPEGAMFLWLWFKDLPIDTFELYERLKKRGVLVISGHYFFSGVPADWHHQHECIRVTYSQEESVVRKGIQLIADEVKSLLSPSA